jgi:cytochrome P450
MNSSRLPYLSAVVYEILRVAPTASATARDAIKETEVLGCKIPKGTFLIGLTNVNGWKDNESRREEIERRVRSGGGGNRKTGLWKGGDEEAKKFDPDRWLDEEGKFNSKNGTWLPFGFGQRNCFGKNLAVSAGISTTNKSNS